MENQNNEFLNKNYVNNLNSRFNKDTDKIEALDLKKAFEFYKKERNGRCMLNEEQFRHSTFALYAVCKALEHDFKEREKSGHTDTKYGTWIRNSIGEIRKIENGFFGLGTNFETYLNINSKLYQNIIDEDKRVLKIFYLPENDVSYDPMKDPDNDEFDKVKFMVKNFVSEDIERIITSEDFKGQHAYPCFNGSEGEIDYENCELEYDYYTWCYVDIMLGSLSIFINSLTYI